jgi:hypothetical protein
MEWSKIGQLADAGILPALRSKGQGDGTATPSIPIITVFDRWL